MDWLYTQLGFDKIIESICSNNHSKRIFVIVGDYKQGKTSLLNCLASHIFNYMPTLGKIMQLNLHSDLTTNSNDYDPFVQYIANNEDLRAKRILAYAQAVAGSFGKLSKTIIKLSNVNSKFSKLYNPTEVTLLEDIEKINNNCPTVFICDDIDKWDMASVDLLKKMMLDKSTKWIYKSIFILSTSSLNNALKLFDYNRRTELLEIFTLTNLPKSAVKNYISSINSQIDSDELFEITKGNLGETCEFIDYFNKVGGVDYFKDIQEILHNRICKQITPQNEYHLALNTEFLQQEATSTINIINRSSVIGDRFQRAILQELSQDGDAFTRHLTYILNSGIYGQRKTELYFTYSTIYSRLREYNQKQLEYHHLFAKALQKITPSNFSLRAQELFLSKSNDWNAAINYFNYIINYSKKYQSSLEIETELKSLLIECGLFNCLESLQKSYQCYYQGNYAQAAALLPCKLSQFEVDFQIDYIRCLILVNRNILKSDYRDAAHILLPWVQSKELRENEPYLWIQAAILYDEIMSEVEGKTKYGDQIINTFHKYFSVDFEFRIEYYDYLSKNNYTYTIDNQYDLTRQAVVFFEQNTQIAGKSLYARAIINHVGNSIVMGAYQEAINLSNEFFKLLSEYSEVKNYLLVLTNNYFVALMLSNKNNYLNATDFADFYESALPRIADDGITSILFKINYGIMLFLSNQENKALDEYSKLYEWVCEESGVDDYYRFFIINNYLLINGYINGNLKDVSFDGLDGLNPYPNNVQFFNRHTKMLKEKKHRFATKQDLMTPMGDSILGKAWSFWGRPLLFTDIQFWSD